MSYTILVVDDELHFRDSIKRILQDAGYCIDTVSTGADVFKWLPQKKYHCILLDLHLPDLNGIEIAEYLTQNHPNVPTIILTGQASVDSAMQAIHIGCYDYLTKPCRPERLLQVIKRAIETQRLKVELTASKDKFKRLSEATWEGIVIFSGTSIIEVNDQFCTLFGSSEQELIGQNLFDIIPALPLPKLAETCTGKTLQHTCEVEAIRKNGEIFPAELRLKQMVNSVKSMWVAAVKDLTEQKKHEQEQLKMQEQLNHARRMESIGIMAGSVAHDLNNILSSIVTFPELLLLDMSPTEKYRKDIARIRTAGKQAAAIVGDLLTVARGSTCQKECHSLNTIVENYVESLDYSQLVESFPDILIDIQLESQTVNAKVSPIHITKTIINLVRNGAESIINAGNLFIKTEQKLVKEAIKGYDIIPSGEYAVLSINDTGTGIPNSAIPHIFEPFYSNKTLGKSGSGLGLTVVHHTIKDHQGYIDVKSKAGCTIFELYFPSCDDKIKTNSSSITLNSILGNGETILIVDDEPRQREITSAILTRLGYCPIIVSTGEAAIQHIKRKPVDLLLLDMVMEPGMSGYETYKQILAISPGQKAVVASGFFNHIEQQKIKTLGVSRYLSKPLSLSSLAQAVYQEINS